MYWIPFCKKPIFLNTREKKPLLAENKSNSFQYIKNKSWGGGRGGAYRCISRRLAIKLQLFEGRLVLTQGQILTGFLFLLGKSIFPDYFLDSFLFFLEHQIIKLWAKRTKLNLAFKLSYLICNFELTWTILTLLWTTLPRCLQVMGLQLVGELISGRLPLEGMVMKEGWYCLNRSIYISEKMPSYPSPKITFCSKWEVSVNVSLGEG